MKAACEYCGRDIEKVRVDRAIATRSWAWKTTNGFYCGRASDGWHKPSACPECRANGSCASHGGQR